MDESIERLQAALEHYFIYGIRLDEYLCKKLKLRTEKGG